jgi:hypothetical protein
MLNFMWRNGVISMDIFWKSGADVEFYLKMCSHNHMLLQHHLFSLLLYCESYLSGSLCPVNVN